MGREDGCEGGEFGMNSNKYPCWREVDFHSILQSEIVLPRERTFSLACGAVWGPQYFPFSAPNISYAFGPT